MSHCNYISHPAEGRFADIDVPGDKSVSHRAVILGAIARGVTTISGFLEGEDCLATVRAFRSMGVNIEGPCKQQLIIHGAGKHGLQKPDSIIDCGNSGTTIRLLSGVLAGQAFDTELSGDDSLRKRPMLRISEPLGLMGAAVATTDGRPPLGIKGGRSLHGIHYIMPVASAQVKSCLLLAGLYASGETVVTEPGPSRDHTERMLQAFSCPVRVSGREVVVRSPGELQGIDLKVPGDLSSAAFFMVYATITPNAALRIRQVGVNPTRTGVIQILRAMGADIRLENECNFGGEPVADILVQQASLHGIDIPAELVPLAIDEFPIIFIAAACARGMTRVRGAGELKSKESDRIQAMVEGLQRLGIDARATEDGAEIKGGKLRGGHVQSWHDHRISMAFAIAGAVADGPVHIDNCANVATSFPTFVQTAGKAGLKITLSGESE